MPAGGALAVDRDGFSAAVTRAIAGEPLIELRREAVDGLPPDESARVREAEQRASAAVVGVTTVEFLDHRDGVIEEGVALRRDLTAAIRRHRPELLVERALADAQSLLAGPAIQARCLECPAIAPPRLAARSATRLTLMDRLFALVWR